MGLAGALGIALKVVNKDLKLLGKDFSDIGLERVLEGPWFDDTRDDRYGS